MKVLTMKVPISLKQFQCDVCQKFFKLLGNLKVHKQTHYGIKPFQCNICIKRFTQKGNLFTHLRVHTGEKPYICRICNRRFRQQTILDQHCRLHRGEKRFKCDECGRRFTQMNHLENHRRVHTGEKPFHCGHCGRSFRYNKTLKIHQLIHTNYEAGKSKIHQWLSNVSVSKEEPKKYLKVDRRHYKCGLCKKVYASKQNLDYHLRSHLGEKPEGCAACPKRFSAGYNLRNHMKCHCLGKHPTCTESVLCSQQIPDEEMELHVRLIHVQKRPYICQVCGMEFSSMKGRKIHRHLQH